MLEHRYRRMSRRTLRSAGVGFRSSGRALAIPNNMPVNGTIEVVSAKRIKREHENDAYVRVRSLRTGQQIVIAELREEWQKLLLPSAGSLHVEVSRTVRARRSPRRRRCQTGRRYT